MSKLRTLKPSSKICLSGEWSSTDCCSAHGWLSWIQEERILDGHDHGKDDGLSCGGERKLDLGYLEDTEIMS